VTLYRRGQFESIYNLAGALGDRDDLAMRIEIIAAGRNGQREFREPFRRAVKARSPPLSRY
jgi:hypothetical protein